jgi:hypothetical protein
MSAAEALRQVGWQVTVLKRAYRIFSIADYLQYPHLIGVSLAELLILLAAAALVVPDAARRDGQARFGAVPATPAQPA